jgi:hypothetical protein
VAQLVEHHLAKVRVAGSNPVVRSGRSVCPCGMPLAAEWPSGLGKGLQSPVHGFDSRLRLHGSATPSGTVCNQAVPFRCFTGSGIAGGPAPNAMKPGLQGVGTHWNLGFMAFRRLWRTRRADLRHSGIARTRSFDVNVPFMQLERHGWDIHAVSAGPDAGEGHGPAVTGLSGNAKAPGVTCGHAPPARDRLEHAVTSARPPLTGSSMP